MIKEINLYIKAWESRGYPDGIPDEVPDLLMDENLAPSYKLIAICILKNDITGLGFTPKPSAWYGVLKKIELESLGKIPKQHPSLF